VAEVKASVSIDDGIHITAGRDYGNCQSLCEIHEFIRPDTTSDFSFEFELTDQIPREIMIKGSYRLDGEDSWKELPPQTRTLTGSDAISEDRGNFLTRIIRNMRSFLGSEVTNGIFTISSFIVALTTVYLGQRGIKVILRRSED
jgi:hypothetical protein